MHLGGVLRSWLSDSTHFIGVSAKIMNINHFAWVHKRPSRYFISCKSPASRQFLWLELKGIWLLRKCPCLMSLLLGREVEIKGFVSQIIYLNHDWLWHVSSLKFLCQALCSFRSRVYIMCVHIYQLWFSNTSYTFYRFSSTLQSNKKLMPYKNKRLKCSETVTVMHYYM